MILLLSLVAVGFAAAYFARDLQRFYRRYRMACKLPGPVGYPIIGHAYLFLGKEFLSVLQDIGSRFTSVVRVWFGTKLVIAVVKPAYAEVVLNSRYALDKGDFYRFMAPLFGEGLIAADSKIWQNNRKVVAPTLNILKIRSYVSMFSARSQLLNERWAANVNGDAFGPSTDISKTMLDFIINTAMGGNSHQWSEDKMEDILGMLSRMEEAIGIRFLRPWLYPDFLFELTTLGQQLKKDTSDFRKFLREMVEKKLESSEEEPGFGFLEHALAAVRNNPRFGDKELMDELSTYITAGFETTSTATAFVLVMLGCHQNFQEKVMEEQNEIFGGETRDVTYEDLSKMAYLEQVVKETMRLYPVITIIGRQITRDLVLGDHEVPEGCFVLVPVFNLHRDASLWARPDEFHPDHFLPQKERERHPYSYLPFGAGPRVCMGQKYAMVVMKTMLSVILRRFRISTDYSIDDISLSKHVTLNTKGLTIRLHDREPSLL